MKKILCLFLSTLMVLPFVCFTQDQDWLIQRGHSELPPPSNDNEVYTLREVGKPNLACNKNADDDIFAIFRDGSYYDSRLIRETQAPGILTFKYDGDDLHIKTAQSIEYMCKTEVYDTGGRPSGVSRSAIETTNPNINNISQNHPTYPEGAMRANRNVVPGKDITLIIDLARLKPGEIYKLTANNIEYSNQTLTNPEENSATQEIMLTSPSEVFNQNFYLGNISVPQISFDTHHAFYFSPNVNEGFLYVNFLNSEYLARPNFLNTSNPNRLVFKLFQTKPITVGNTTLSINELTSDQLLDADWTKLSTHSEEIRNAHDPNYIASMKICDENVVKYNISFHNDQTEPASHLKCIVKFNPDLNPLTACISSASHNGELIYPTLEFSGSHELVITMPEEMKIICCDDKIHPVRIALDVKFDKNFSTSHEPEPTIALSIFNSHLRKYKQYYELKYIDSTCLQKVDLEFAKPNLPLKIVDKCQRKQKKCSSCTTSYDYIKK